MTTTDTTTPPAPPDDASAQAATTYADLLDLPRLLDVLAVDDRERDCDLALFLTSHQICEAAFALIRRHLEEARDHLTRYDTTRALRRLQALPALVHTVIQQIDVLTSLTPDAFEAVRDRLGNASGIQSLQWRDIEYLAGRRDRRWLNTKGFTPADRARLQRRLAEPSLSDAFTDLTRRHRRTPTGGPPATEVAAVRDALLIFDDTVTLWRSRHAILAERLLGGRSGTAGTTGAAYLWRQASCTRLFPSLRPHP